MKTKKWGVLSFLVGIAVTGLLREVPTNMSWIALGSFSCALIGYGVWHFILIRPRTSTHAVH